jgi:subtilase family serine protease
MEGLLKNRGRSLPAQSNRTIARRRRPGAGRLVLASLLLTSGAMLAEVTSVEVSPLVKQSTLVGPVDKAKQISIALAFPFPDPAAVATFIKHVSTPGDSLYRQYLTPQQFADRFGPSAADYTAVKSWAAANQLEVTLDPVTRVNLTLRGSAEQLEKLFKTQINTYRSADGTEFFSAGVQLSIPSEIASRISAVVGLTESKQFAPHVKVGKVMGESPKIAPDTAGGTGPGGFYSAKDLRTVYAIPSWGSLDKKEVVAVFEQGGFVSSDVARYEAENKLPATKVTPVSVNNSPTEPDPLLEGDVLIEADLDIDMVIGINPDVKQVLVYIDSVDSFQTALLDAITQVGTDGKAQILSISYGQDETLQGNDAINAENSALEVLATEGITVLASSGDNGAYGNFSTSPYNVSDPASQPYVTGVGGTTLYTGPDQQYAGEIAWNELYLGHGATGGGISAVWKIPDFQKGEIGFANGYFTVNGGSNAMRNIPDVAAVADPLTGVALYVKAAGGWISIGGTSVAAPIWAGYLSVLNAATNWSGLGYLGYFNPLLYSAGASLGVDPDEVMYDVAQGSNGYTPFYGSPGYTNGPGYSNTTGNGGIWGGGFAAQLITNGQQSGTKPGVFGRFEGKVSGDTVAFSWTPSTGATAYYVGVYHFGTYGFNLNTSYITKDTKLTVKGLPPLPSGDGYTAEVWAFNPSGSYRDPGGFIFNTK